jgi:rubrerythrin
MSSLIDEDELECKECGHIGMLLNGDFDVECPNCGAEYSYMDEEE